MSPESITISLFSFMLGLFISFLHGKFAEKGKNQATKEDIKEITEKIESVKTEIWQATEISQYRYDKEYKILRELNDAIYAHRLAFHAIIEVYDRNEFTRSTAHIW